MKSKLQKLCVDKRSYTENRTTGSKILKVILLALYLIFMPLVSQIFIYKRRRPNLSSPDYEYNSNIIILFQSNTAHTHFDRWRRHAIKMKHSNCSIRCRWCRLWWHFYHFICIPAPDLFYYLLWIYYSKQAASSSHNNKQKEIKKNKTEPNERSTIATTQTALVNNEQNRHSHNILFHFLSYNLKLN